MKKTFFALGSVLSLSTLLLSSTLSPEVHNNSLVIYNSNIALVHEERALDLSKSDSFITYEGVASSIETDSVNVTLPKGVSLYSQQYRFDKLTQAKLLDAHLEKEVEIRLANKHDSFDIFEAILLANNGSNAIVQTKNKKIFTIPSSDIIFKTIPVELITQPSLVWNVQVDKTIKSDLKLDYLINDISFKSDYILNIDENIGNLTGWITIDNHSGKRFESTQLSLLAGDIHRVNNQPIMYKQVRAMAVTDSAQEVAHQAYEGYHFYTIPFKVTLTNNEKTQLKFINKAHFKVQREYSAMLHNPLYFNGEVKSDVEQFISLDGFDIPLPKGVVRTYAKLDGVSILLGENTLEHTPQKSPIKLNIGKNFDIKVIQRVVSRKDTKTEFNALIEYTIINSSKDAKTVQLLIPFNRNKKSKINTEQKYSFTKGNLVTFSIQVPSESTQSFNVNFESKK
jgi:hypothetical protein